MFNRAIARRRYLTWIATCTLATTVCFGLSGIVAGNAHATGGSVTPPPIDLSNPTATINDPAGSLPYVNTECQPGQTDLNTASATTLTADLGIPSGPTVNRLIAMRPWLKGSDLSSVPGIGPALAAQIAPHTCATQLILPPATPLACTSANQIDLQTESAATIASNLGLSLNAAQILVSARPLPQNLQQLTSPRIPGFPTPISSQLAANGSLCITPAPLLAGGSAYRWATPNGGTVVSREGFSLIVPPGRVTNPAGAYAQVTPMAPDSGILPQADFEIDGTWNEWNTTVAVQGPYIAPGAPGGPVVLHAASDGERFSIGSGAVLSMVNGAPTVTAAETSLSPSVFGYTPCAGSDPATFGGNPACLQAMTDGSLNQAWLDNATASGQSAQTSLADQRHCANAGTGTVDSGSLPFGMLCDSSFDAPSGDATWTMTNKAYLDIAHGLVSGEVVYDYSTSGGQYNNPPSLTGGAESNIIMSLLGDYAGPHFHLILAGVNLGVTKTQGFETTTVNVNSDPPATAVWNGLNNVLSVFGDLADGTVLEQAITYLGYADTIKGCLNSPITSGDLGCIKGILDKVAQYLDSPAGVAHFGVATADQAAYATAHTFFKWMAAAQWVGSFLASVVFQHIGGTGVVLSNQPPAPATDGEGRAVDSTCLSHNDTIWIVDPGCQDYVYEKGSTPIQGSGGGNTGLDQGIIVRDPAGHAYFADQTNMTISPINTSALYLCLAQHYIVDWNYDPTIPGNARYAAFAWTQTQAACDPNAPASAAPTEPNNVVPLYTVLREPDGTSWVVDGSATNEMRVPIPNGTEFNCWVSPDPSWPVIESNVWDQVTTQELANYPIDPNTTSLSNCYPPTF